MSVYYEQDVINTANIDIDHLFHKDTEFNLICYHINSKSGQYPFVQFMVYNDPENGFTMPTCTRDNVEDVINTNLQQMGVLKEYLNEDDLVFKGFYKNKYTTTDIVTYSLLFDVSTVDLSRIMLLKTSPVWFALYTEIVNNCKICNIPVSPELTNFYTRNYNLSKIYSSPNKKEYYPIPLVVYTGEEFSRVKFKGLFGEPSVHRDDIDSEGSYYYFETDFNYAAKAGGWSYNFQPLIRFNKLVTDTDNGRFIQGGINRYAFFQNKTLILEDLRVPFDFENYDTHYVDGLIISKTYEQHVPLSYHMLDKTYISKDKEWEPYTDYHIL